MSARAPAAAAPGGGTKAGALARSIALAVPVAILTAWAATTAHAASDPWLDRVVDFAPGPSSGFGADQLPGIVLGIPEGLGDRQGSVDVVSFGKAGSIVVAFADNAVVDGEGDDLVIYENPFYGGELLFEELAFVEVSADGRNWTMFPFDAETHEGLAGRAPVMSSSENGLDPLDPASGGDRFDLADIGVDYVRFLRITDAGDEIDDPGNHSFAGSKGGFDLDAAAAIHSTALGCISGVVSEGGLPLASVRVVAKSEGQRARRRVTQEDGRYRFCRLKPGEDYDLAVRIDGATKADARVFVGEEQLRVTVDLFVD